MRIAEWTLKESVLFGDKTIGVFATDPDAATRLAANMNEFAPTLPEAIKVKSSTVGIRRSDRAPT